MLTETIYNCRTEWWATKTRGSLRRTLTTTSLLASWRLRQAASTSNQQVSPASPAPPAQIWPIFIVFGTSFSGPSGSSGCCSHLLLIGVTPITYLIPSPAKSKTNGFIQFLKPEILISDIIVSNYFHQPEVKFPGKILLWRGGLWSPTGYNCKTGG